MAQRPTPIGELVQQVVARSTLTGVTEDWQRLDEVDASWLAHISLMQGKLSLIHFPSQTRSETSFDKKTVITAQDVFVTDRDAQRCEDGHWVRVHGLMAERILRTSAGST